MFKKNIFIVMNNTTCLFDRNNNPICLPTDLFNKLRVQIMNKFELKHLPTLNEIKDILNIEDNIQLENRIITFLNDNTTTDRVKQEFRHKVPNIFYHGLTGTNLVKIFNLLNKYYPNYHYRGPCLLDYKKSWFFNYSDFSRFPLFNQNNKVYDIYYLLLLNVELLDIKPGHWMGVCVVENAIIYYDSLNYVLNNEFKYLLDLIFLELKLSNANVLSWRNNKRIQFSGKHCGVFQIHFITTILELYKQNKLFTYTGNIIKTKALNEKLLSFYLQDNLTQDIIEQQISNYFYVNL